MIARIAKVIMASALFFLTPKASAKTQESILEIIQHESNCDKLSILADSANQLAKTNTPLGVEAAKMLLLHEDCKRAFAYGNKIMSNHYMVQYKIDSAQYYINIAHTAALQTTDSVLIFLTELIQGQALALKSEAQSAIKCFEGSKQYFKEVKPHLYKFILEQLANCYQVAGQYENLKNNSFECIRIGKQDQDNYFIALGNYYLAVSAFENKQFDEAKMRNDTAEHYGLLSQQTLILRGIYALDQLFFNRENMPDSVKETLKKLDKVVRTLDDNQKMWQKTNWINFYSSVGDFARSGLFADTILNFAKTNYVNPVIEHYAMVAKGRSLLELKKYPQSLVVLKTALNYYRNNSIYEEYIANLPHLISAFGYNNLPDSVKHYIALYETLKDSVYSAQNQEALTEMSVKYETEIKEEQIADQKNELAMKAATEKQQWVIIWISLVGLAIVVVLAFLLFQANRQKQKNLHLALTQKDQIAQQSEERELLLKEIHHRVKNNLQIISNLLELQATKSDSDTSAALMEGQLRVQSMAMIHQKLYQQDNVAVLDFNAYLQSMAGNWKNSFETQKPTELVLHCENVALDIDTSIPLGLIINELITNAYKHAFAATPQPKITLNLKQLDAGNYQLIVHDNGLGIDVDIKQLKSLGMRLVNRLVKQLGGEMKIENHKGAYFSIVFKDALLRGQVE